VLLTVAAGRHAPAVDPSSPRPAPPSPPAACQSVHGMGTKTLEEVGAGDQGHMFGYASDETPELMPLTHVLATQIGYKLTEVGRRAGVGGVGGCALTHTRTLVCACIWD
jgi:hypothetical protein